MHSFISIVFIQTHAISKERIAVGLLAITDSNTFFGYSRAKLEMLNTYYPKVYAQAQLVVSLIEEKINSLPPIGTIESTTTPTLTKDYVDYMNTYSKGVLQFEVPRPYALLITAVDFPGLFEKFIGESSGSVLA